MKHAHAHGTLKHHCQMLIGARKLKLPEESLHRYIDEMEKAFNELHDEFGTLKEINEGNRK